MRIESPNHIGLGMRDHPRYRSGIHIRHFSEFGGEEEIIPSFWAPFNDLGAGAADLTLVAGTGSATFTRATTAYTRSKNGNWVSVNSGTARSYYDASGNYRGVLIEGARTNNALQSRDLSNAAWTKSNTTGTKTATGIDGVLLSCSLLTATLANGTCLQSVTEGSAAKTFSAWVKRSSGSGEIDITIDGGTTWVDITSQINSSTFSLVQVNQTVTNQNFGFRIVTSADAIIVDMCQEETGLFASSPYPAIGASVTRNSDVLTYSNSGVEDDTVGTAYCEITYLGKPVSTTTTFIGNQGATYFLASGSNPMRLTIYDGTTGPQSGLVTYVGNTVKAASTWGGSTKSVVGSNGGTLASDSFDGSMSSGTNIGIGARNGNDFAFSAIRNAKISKRKSSSSQLQAMVV